jgi:hypothetical protein
MDWTLLLAVQLWIAIVIVVTLHEIGHIPKRIKFYWNIIPSAYADSASWREGGLFVNVLLFYLVYVNQPENVLLQLVGLLAWMHFILYAIVGSIVPEPKDDKRGFSYWDRNSNGRWDLGEPFVNLRTYVFDDVDNGKWYLWIPAAIGSYILFSPYYLPILKGLIPW